MNDASETAAAPPTPAPYRGSGCAGTTPSTDGPCEVSATEEVDGLPLCGPHAQEFWAEARADALEVATTYLSRWLRVAREELCNDELARRLEAALEGLGAEEAESAHAAPERDGGGPGPAPVWQTGSGGRRADPGPQEDGASSAAGGENAAGLRRDRGVGARRGSRLGDWMR